MEIGIWEVALQISKGGKNLTHYPKLNSSWFKAITWKTKLLEENTDESLLNHKKFKKKQNSIKV